MQLVKHNLFNLSKTGLVLQVGLRRDDG